MKRLAQVAVLLGLFSGSATAQQFNQKIGVMYSASAAAAPYLVTNYMQNVPTINMTGGEQWKVVTNDTPTLCIVEDWNQMVKHWEGNVNNIVDGPDKLAYREKVLQLQVQAEEIIYYSDPFNVQKLTLWQVLGNHLTWYVVGGCFAFCVLLRKPGTEFESLLGKTAFMGLVTIGLQMTIRMPHDFEGHRGFAILMGVLLVLLCFIILSTIKERFAKTEDEEDEDED